MSIQFSSVPTTKVPGWYAEITAKLLAGAGTYERPTALVGQMTSAGTATAGIPVRVLSPALARTLFGEGSSLAAQCAAYLANDPAGELWGVPLADNGGGTAATGSIALTGLATASGTLALIVAGRRVEVAVTSGDSATDVGDAIDTAVAAADNIPVTTANTTGTVAVTARHKGTVGNQIKIYLDPDGVLPAGLAVSITQISSGAIDPTADGTTATADQQFDSIGLHLTTTAMLNAWKTAVDARWGPTGGGAYGHVFGCIVDSVSNLASAGAARNNAHETLLGVTTAYSPAYEIGAAYCGAVTARLRLDPAANVTGVPIEGIRGPLYTDRHTYTEADTLLDSGIATATIAVDGTLAVQRPVTTYKTNSAGDADLAWLDTQTATTATRFTRRMQARAARMMAGAKLADDGTPVGGGRAVVTPSSFKAGLVAEYRQMQSDGLVENLDAFIAGLVVERDGVDRNRMNVYMPPDWVNQFLVTAAVINFEV